MHNSLLSKAFGPGSIILAKTAKDWRQALTIAGGGLVASGRTSPEYSTQMIETVERLGPYIVIAPGIALGHAKTSAAVLQTGLALAIFDEPVVFGHKSNDPVHLVFALAALDHTAHLGLMADFAGWVADENIVKSLLTCSSERMIRDLL